jgi:hypothetical protein
MNNPATNLAQETLPFTPLCVHIPTYLHTHTLHAYLHIYTHICAHTHTHTHTHVGRQRDKWIRQESRPPTYNLQLPSTVTNSRRLITAVGLNKTETCQYFHLRWITHFFRIELVYSVQKPSNVGLREETWVQVIAVLRPVDKTERWTISGKTCCMLTLSVGYIDRATSRFAVGKPHGS